MSSSLWSREAALCDCHALALAQCVTSGGASSGPSTCVPRALSVSRHFSALAAAHEEPIELGDADLVPRRAAVVALARALGRLHFAQQGVHLGQRKAAVGAHRGVA